MYRPEKFRHWAAVAVFVGPFLTMLALFQYFPVFEMLRDSFYDFSLLNLNKRRYVGLENFLTIFEDPDRLQAFYVTFLFAAGVVVTVIPVSFAVALYLNGRLPMRAIVRTVVFLPVVTSVVVIATMFTFLYDPANGLVNSTLGTIGLPKLQFHTNKHQALPSVVAMMVWQQTGFATVLFLSGLQGIPRDLEDAARVDGCSAWQRIRFVVIPLLMRTTVFVVVIMTVFSLQVFAPALVLTGGGPEGTTNFVAYDIYQLAFYLQMPGLASAVSVVFMVIVLTISLIQMRVLRVKETQS